MRRTAFLTASVIVLCLLCAAWGRPTEGLPQGRGGSYFVLEVEKTKGMSLGEAREGVIRVLTKRMEGGGVRDPFIVRQGPDRIIVEFPGIADRTRYRRLIESQAFMRWMLVAEDRMNLEQFSESRLRDIYDRAVRDLSGEFADKKDALGNPIKWTAGDLDRKLEDSIPPDTILRIYRHEERDMRGATVEKQTPLLLRSSKEEPEVIKADQIKSAVSRRDPETGEPIISFALKAEGTRKFGNVTRKYNSRSENTIAGPGGGPRGWRLAILLDDRVISAPHIKTEILGGSGQIEGNFTPEEARDLAIQLRAGALPARVRVVAEGSTAAKPGD